MSNPAAQLAAMRRREQKSCAVCGETFTAITKAKYCSNRCKQKAKYRRNQEKAMSYEVAASLYDSRRDAIDALVANWISAGGRNDADDIRGFLKDKPACVAEMLEYEWTELGEGVDPATPEELAEAFDRLDPSDFE